MGTAERKEREKEQRRNDIIDAAERVFFAKGLSTATVDQIAEEAEISKGTIYLYFKNKEDLAFAISLRGAAIITAKFEAESAKGVTGLEKISGIGHAYYQFYVEYPEYASFMNQVAESGENAGVYAQKCAKEGMRVYKIMEDAIKLGIEDGSMRKDLDPSMTALLLSNFSTGLMNAVVNQGAAISELMGLDIERYVDYAFGFMKVGMEG